MQSLGNLPVNDLTAKDRFGFAATLFADYLTLPELYRLCLKNGLFNCGEVWTRRLQVDYNVDAVTNDPFTEYKQHSLYDLYRKIQPIYVSPDLQTFVGLSTNLWSMPALVRWWTAYVTDPTNGGLVVDANTTKLLNVATTDVLSLDDIFKAISQHISRKRPQLTWEELVVLQELAEVVFGCA